MLKSATSLLQADGSFPERENEVLCFFSLNRFWTQDFDLNLFRHSCASINLSRTLSGIAWRTPCGAVAGLAAPRSCDGTSTQSGLSNCAGRTAGNETVRNLPASYMS